MTKRESEVLNSLFQGLTNKQIATSLGISDFTVRDHVSSILRKKGVGSRAELLAAEIKNKTL
ncbi:LuxR C-terminal-related transcriptional regulator [Pseudomonas sp. fls2-241-R2A-110]|jgi:DNA-binding NarL/FixJ family response regulator|uniref:LuxR C-terminal-related transcriptional regulator n=1 Tax=unclassified Pseudomonas TaxID=196821 RepID=UPI002553DD5E|nr:LuxR C-terminal-related transcriptional regulator [Pseudomonas sp. fls2-241-R2A-110]